jgi:hypothetical protein
MKKYADYSDLCGIWTAAEEAEFHAHIEDMGTIERYLDCRPRA